MEYASAFQILSCIFSQKSYRKRERERESNADSCEICGISRTLLLRSVTKSAREKTMCVILFFSNVIPKRSECGPTIAPAALCHIGAADIVFLFIFPE